MKKIIAFSLIFAILGCGILFGSAYYCLTSLDAPAVMLRQPGEALACSENLMEALSSGDYAAASGCLQGQVDLGLDREPEDETGKLLWEAFEDSFAYEFTGACVATNSGVARTVRITTLDPSTVNGQLSQRVDALLEARLEAAEDTDDIYDESGNFRQELLDALLLEALEEALREDAATVTREISLNLVYQNGQWWVVPDAALIQAISGGVAG